MIKNTISEKKSNFYLRTMVWSVTCIVFLFLSAIVHYRGVSGLPYFLWGEKTISQDVITYKEGNLYIADLGDNRLSSHLRPSPGRLLEDGEKLGPANANRNEIKSKGKGRYVFLDNNLYFSSSNNSNPMINDRIYQIQYPLILWEEAVYGITLVLIAGIIAAAILAAGPQRDEHEP
jgi:hypothetical protein